MHNYTPIMHLYIISVWINLILFEVECMTKKKLLHTLPIHFHFINKMCSSFNQTFDQKDKKSVERCAEIKKSANHFHLSGKYVLSSPSGSGYRASSTSLPHQQLQPMISFSKRCESKQQVLKHRTESLPCSLIWWRVELVVVEVVVHAGGSRGKVW